MTMTKNFASIAAAALTIVLPLQSSAAGDSKPYRLPTVYVSASRIPDTLGAVGRNVVILDRQEIERRAAVSIADLLDGLPGVDARSRGPFGVQTDLEVAGATFSQVLLMIDGVRVNDPQTGHHNLNLPIEPGDLERVEVVYGAGSSVHGPDAFGAVINLVPLRETATRLDLGSYWGRALDGDGVAGVGTDAAIRHGWSGDWGRILVSAAKRRSDGYRVNTNFDIDRVFVVASKRVRNGELSLQAGVQDKVFGAQDFYGAPSKEWTNGRFFSAQYRQSPSSARSALSARNVVARAYYRRHRDRFVLLIQDPAFYENRHVSERAGAEGYVTLVSGAWGSILAGAEVVGESIDSRNLNSPRFRGLGEHGRWRRAFFSEYGGNLDNWAFRAGLRFDRHEHLDWVTSPSLGTSYTWRGNRVFGSVARAFRAPSFTEFYYEDTRNRGNPALEAEQGWSYEAGVQVRPVKGAHLRTSAFARYENDLVDYVRPDTTVQWAATNLGEMRTLGFQVQAERSWPHLRPQLNYTWVDKEQTLEEGFLSKYVFTHPTHQLTLRLDHAVMAGIDAGWQLQLRERSRLEDYTVVDLVLSRPFSYGRSLLRVRNVTDEKYEAVEGVPMPGRWFGLETQIDL